MESKLLIALVLGAVLVAATAATVTTYSAYAYTNNQIGMAAHSANGVIPPGHNACDNAGPAASNPNC